MKSIKIKHPSDLVKALYWVKEEGKYLWCPVTCTGHKTSSSTMDDRDILNGLFCGYFVVNDEKLDFEFIN